MDIFEIFNRISGFVDSAINFITSIDWMRIIFILKVVSIVASVFLFVGIVYTIIRLNLISRFKTKVETFILCGKAQEKLFKKWQKIVKKVKSKTETDQKLAVIEADNFFDNILKKVGYFGQDMGQRLKQITPSQIKNIDDIWKAHKIRNNIVHDSDYKLNREQAEKSVNAYEKGLKELEVL